VVRFRLIPRDEGFYELFNEAALNVEECARRLQEVLDDDFSNPEIVEKQLALVIECERRGDELTKTILRRLNSSFVTPFDREDIHALTEELDDVVDEMQAAADLLVLHKVDRSLPEAADLSRVLVEAAGATVRLVAKLPILRGMEPELEAIDRLESEADKIYRRCVAHLFSGEFKAFTVLRWKDIVESIESAVNDIENVSDIVESISLKHA
jgi:predicted phosphate transport protein (TIGR00153 family)